MAKTPRVAASYRAARRNNVLRTLKLVWPGTTKVKTGAYCPPAIPRGARDIPRRAPALFMQSGA